MSRKLFPGPRLRRFRLQRGLTQVELAQSLSISASYLNQIENNQRPLTAAVLLKLSGAYDIDLQMLSDDEDDRVAAELHAAMCDSIFQGNLIDIAELKEVTALSPDFARRFLVLYRAWRAGDQQMLSGDSTSQPGDIDLSHDAQFHYDQVRDFFTIRDNYIDELDVAAEHLQQDKKFRLGNMEDELTKYLQQQYGVNRVYIDGDDSRLSTSKFNKETRTLTLSMLLPQSRRCFHLANHLCRLEHDALLDRIVASANFSTQEANSICRIGLANYFAAALLMPYQIFLDEAQRYKYDIAKLEMRFGVTFESICHRLSSMQRPSAKGVPFYFVRVDIAGNISKRQCAPDFYFARSGGACPLWNIHDAFTTPGKMLKQLAQMPDGKTYFCIAQTVTKQAGGYLEPERKFSIGFGCEIRHAAQLVYATGMDLDNVDAVVPIGPSCRLCERLDCAQRASPPVGHKLSINENQRSFQPYIIDL
ncbi:MAG: short-chain fatty acyl-CoA regulator family protein [Granulosicoccus sp.]